MRPQRRSLEQRYRDALLWYPQSWRDAHEEVVLSTLLDVAQAEGRARPTLVDRFDLMTQGIRVSMATALPSAVRDRASSVALGIGAALSAVLLVQLEVLAWRPHPTYPVEAVFGPFLSPAVALYALMIVAFVLAMVGFARSARLAALATLPMAILVRVVADAAELWGRPSWTTMALVCMLALIGAAGNPARTTRGVGWSGIAAVVALAIFIGNIAVQGVTPLRDPAFMTGQVYELTLWGLGAGTLMLAAFGKRTAAGATLLVAAPWLMLIAFGKESRAILLERSLLLAALALAAVMLLLLARAVESRRRRTL